VLSNYENTIGEPYADGSLFSLKVPKCEIFHLFNFNDFYGINSLKVGDLRDEIKN
jgi:hypothetical protein